MLGALLGVRAQLQLQAGVALVVDAAVGGEPAWAGAGDGADGDLTGLGRVEQRGLGRGPEELEVGGAQVEPVRARVRAAQLVVSGQRVRAGHGEAARGHHLVDVSGSDGLLHRLDSCREVSVGLGGHGVDHGGDRRLARCALLVLVRQRGLVDGVDRCRQRAEATLQVSRVHAGSHEGGLTRGVVDDEDDPGIVEDVVGAGVGPGGHCGKRLEGGQVVEGDDPGLQRQVRVVDLDPGQHPQRLDRGGRPQPLALLGLLVRRRGGKGEAEAVRTGVVSDVGGQVLTQPGHGRLAVGLGLRQGLDTDALALAGQACGGLQHGDGGA